MWMAADIRFDRKIQLEEHCVLPGGYEMRIGGKDVSFDFTDYDMETDKEDQTILHCRMWGLDTASFPESKELWHAEGSVEKILEFIIYTGDEDEPEILPLELLSLSLYKEDGDVFPVADGALEGVFPMVI